MYANFACTGCGTMRTYGDYVPENQLPMLSCSMCCRITLHTFVAMETTRIASRVFWTRADKHFTPKHERHHTREHREHIAESARKRWAKVRELKAQSEQL